MQLPRPTEPFVGEQGTLHQVNRFWRALQKNLALLVQHEGIKNEIGQAIFETIAASVDSPDDVACRSASGQLFPPTHEIRDDLTGIAPVADLGNPDLCSHQAQWL